jgi:hypothetical protein
MEQRLRGGCDGYDHIEDDEGKDRIQTAERIPYRLGEDNLGSVGGLRCHVVSSISPAPTVFNHPPMSAHVYGLRVDGGSPVCRIWASALSSRVR